MKLTIIISILLFPILAYAGNIKFNYTYKSKNITIQTQDKISEGQIKEIVGIYNNSKNLFFTYFERIDINKCRFNSIIIKLVDHNQINDNKIFHKGGGNVFGRFFWRTRTIFIDQDFFQYSAYLAHELAHYYYHSCHIFKGERKEEINAYQFQDLYMGFMNAQ